MLPPMALPDPFPLPDLVATKYASLNFKLFLLGKGFQSNILPS